MQKFIYALVLLVFGISACCKEKPCTEIFDEREVSLDCSSSPPHSEIFKIAEEKPFFTGCEGITDKALRDSCTIEKINEFISQNLQYPPEAEKEQLEGSVRVSIIVEKDGCISFVRIAKDIGCGCAEESIRLVELMPKWFPGKQMGSPVAHQFVFDINFEL